MEMELQTINPTDNLEELEQNMASWLKLPHKFKLLSDDECIKKYNYTNIDLYNKLKSDILNPNKDKKVEKLVKEDFIDNTSEDEYNINTLFNTKDDIKDLYNFYTKDPNITLIAPWEINDIESLNIAYNRYIMSNTKFRRFSNYYSQILFGYDVPNIYNIISNRLENQKSIIEPNVLTKISENLNKAVCENDMNTIIEYEKAYIKHSFSKVADNIIIRESINEAKQDIYQLKSDSKRDLSCFKAVPWFTPDDNMGDFLEFYEDNEYINKLKEAYTNYKYHITDEKPLLELGWNPSVPLTIESMNYAKERLSNYIESHCCSDIIDLTKVQFPSTIISESSNRMRNLYKEKNLYPVFIVLSFTNTVFGKIIRFAKKSTYTHAGLSLDSNLKNILTFKYGSNYNGFNFESIKTYTDTYDGALLEILCLFVDEETKYKIEQSVKYYIKNQNDTKYGFKNLFNILLNKRKEVTDFDKELVCSQFVDHILKLCNIDILKKPNNLVIPQDYATIAVKHPRVYKIYEGLAKLYNEKKVENIIENLFTINDRGIKYINEAGIEIEIPINLEPSIITIPK